MKLAGSVAVVTGGASGLGRATGTLLAARGARVALLDLPGSHGAAVAAGLSSRARADGPGGSAGHASSPGAAFVPVDIADEASVAAAIDTVRRNFGTVHACINCAGVPGSMKLLDREGKPSHGALFRRTLAVNLEGTFNTMAHCAALMRGNPPDADGERGVIINVASIAATDGTIGHVAYAASKAGITGMMLPVARELADDGIRVLTIAPGLFDTPMAGSVPPRGMQRLLASVAFPKRLGDPAEFAALVAHLCENSYLNAETIRLDGAQRL